MRVDKVVYEAVAGNEKISETTPPPRPPKGFGVRHLQTLLLFIGLTIAFAMRSQLNVLMVAMARSNHVGDYQIVTENSTNVTSGELCEEVENVSSWSVYRSYDWDKSTQEVITFAFFVGYTGMQLPMGWLTQRFRGKGPIMVALAVNGLLSIAMPWVALLGGWIGTSICRFFLGTTQAAFYPSMHTMLSKWAPLSERARLTTYSYAELSMKVVRRSID